MENPVKKVLEKPLLNWEKDLQHRQLPYHNHKLAQLRKVKAVPCLGTFYQQFFKGDFDSSSLTKSTSFGRSRLEVPGINRQPRLSGLASHEDNS